MRLYSLLIKTGFPHLAGGVMYGGPGWARDIATAKKVNDIKLLEEDASQPGYSWNQDRN